MRNLTEMKIKYENYMNPKEVFEDLTQEMLGATVYLILPNYFFYENVKRQYSIIFDVIKCISILNRFITDRKM